MDAIFFFFVFCSEHNSPSYSFSIDPRNDQTAYAVDGNFKSLSNVLTLFAIHRVANFDNAFSNTAQTIFVHSCYVSFSSRHITVLCCLILNQSR